MEWIKNNLPSHKSVSTSCKWKLISSNMRKEGSGKKREFENHFFINVAVKMHDKCCITFYRRKICWYFKVHVVRRSLSIVCSFFCLAGLSVVTSHFLKYMSVVVEDERTRKTRKIDYLPALLWNMRTKRKITLFWRIGQKSLHIADLVSCLISPGSTECSNPWS